MTQQIPIQHDKIPCSINMECSMEDENIVKKACKELGITQKELAEKIGIDDGTVRKWSSSRKLPAWGVNFINTIIENELLESKVKKINLIINLIDEIKGVRKTNTL